MARSALALLLIGVLGVGGVGWFPPVDAKYFPEINSTLNLNPVERVQLRSNGFVVSDRLAFADFETAYAYIYWKDLPVLITTDSLLQVMHRNYDFLLEGLETTLLATRLEAFLAATRRQVQADQAANHDPQLAPVYADVDTYFAVPELLLHMPVSASAAAQAYYERAATAGSRDNIDLFGTRHPVDFTLFKPRGHYTHSNLLGRYFAAVSWLGQVDFRLVDYDPAGRPTLNSTALAGAALLRAALDRAG